MERRQYGVLPGSSLTGTPPPSYSPSQRISRSQSPLKTLVSPFQDGEHSPRLSQGQSRAGQHSYEQLAGSAHHVRSKSNQTPPRPPVHRSVAPQAQSRESPFYNPAASETTSSEMSSYSPQDSRARALQDVDNLYSPRLPTSSPQRDAYFHSPYRDESPRVRQDMSERRTSKSPMPYVAPAFAAAAPAASPARISQRQSVHSMSNPPTMLPRASYYQGDGYDDIDPNSIADDPDDDDVFRDPAPRSGSRLSYIFPVASAGTAAVKPFAQRGGSGQYQAVSTSHLSLQENKMSEKSDWLENEDQRRRRRKRLLIILGIVLLIGVIVGAVVGGVLASRKSTGGGNSSSASSSSSSSSAASGGTHSGGKYDIDSNEVQAVLRQKDLHKVFPGMDYTPLNSQYPDCLHNPPNQNNITLDVAVLSQLTPAIRLYGTDCGQTEMVLEAINLLKMNDTMQVWLGVWLGNNATTNTRQISHMYSLLDSYPTSHFAGIIVGNEVLFRQDLTLTQLGQTLTQIRTNLTAKGVKLPLATSDLGDNWNAGLAATSDIVMANIHPLFAGITPDLAPGWTWNFWQTRNSKLVPATTGSWPKSIISEVGWPSEGGNNCGTGTTSCPAGQGAVASVDNMNTFMDGFVCQSLNNGTTFFWFSAFDEPWKAIFNTVNDMWESKWGLMDVDRNLKPGLNIPDCGGKTVSKAY